eukprot:jgi/Undpi1/3151/HiC_scaffold_15.g06525.m1
MISSPSQGGYSMSHSFMTGVEAAAWPSNNGHASGNGGPRGGSGTRSKTKGVDGGAASRMKALLSDIAKISPSSGDDAPQDALERFLASVTSVQALEIFKESPPSAFVEELLAHLTRLLPGALASPAGAAAFIECLQPFEGLDNFVLTASFYRAVASAEEPPKSPPRGHTWKRRKAQTGTDPKVASPVARSSTVTGLETLREYLCMNGRDSIDCDRRTVVTTLTRALLGSWEASVVMGRELFDQSVLKSPDRAGPVGLGLEILLQCLVQEDEAFCAAEKTTDGEEASPRSSDPRDRDGNRNDDRDKRSKGPDPSSATDEIRACVAIVGNYVRADADTAGAFFRDIIPKVMVMGSEGGGRGRAVSGRIPCRLAAVLRKLVDSTRTRNSFNVERMVVHTVKEVKGWLDDVLSSKPFDAAAAAGVVDGISEDGQTGTMKGRNIVFSIINKTWAKIGGSGEGKKSSNDGKLRRRRLALACLDVLGLKTSCISLIRAEMVDGEAKASLRSAVADAVLEYRRTCHAAGAEHAQAFLLGILSPLAEDGVVNVRLSAVAAVAEACKTKKIPTLAPPMHENTQVCSSDCVPAASLLLKRCLDTSTKVRRLAVRLLVDEFSVGTGTGGAKLARALLASSASSRGDTNALRAPDDSSSLSRQGGREGNGQSGLHAPRESDGSVDRSRQDRGGGGHRMENGGGSRGVVSVQEGESGVALLGRLLRHQKALEETDKER